MSRLPYSVETLNFLQVIEGGGIQMCRQGEQQWQATFSQAARSFWGRLAFLAVNALCVLAGVPASAFAAPPVATTESATAVSYEQATLKGTVNPEGSTTSYYFEYGKTESYGTKVPVSPESIGSGTSNVAVSQTVTGLSAGSPYHFRVVAKSEASTTEGKDKTFTPGPQFSFAFGEKGYAEGQFQHPAEIAFDAKGNVWVVDENDSRIEEFDEKGKFLFEFGEEGEEDGQLWFPASLAIDAKGNIWVADAENIRIEEFDQEGKYLSKFGEVGFGDGQFFIGPESIAIDPKGNIWVADTYDGRLQKFNKEGKFLKVFSSFGSEPGELGEPSGIDIGPGGNVWVADSWNDRVTEFNEAGKFVKQFGEEGSGDGQFHRPNTIEVDESGNVWVVDQGNGRVEQFSEAGKYLGKFGTKGSGEGQFGLTWPTGITTDAEGNLWIADTNNNRVQKWTLGLPKVVTEAATAVKGAQATLNGKVNPEGSATSYWFEYGKTTSYGTKIPLSSESVGSGTSSVAVSQTPTGLSENTLYHFRVVAKSGAGTRNGEDRTLTTLKLPDATTESATSIELTQATLNGKVNPLGLATSYWFEYGTTTGYGTKIPVSPESVGSGSEAKAVSQIPTGLKAETEYHFRLAAESEAGTVNGEDKTFKTGPRFLLAFGKEGAGKGEFRHPADIAIDSEGNAWVVDMENDRLEKFDKEGKYLTGFGEAGKGKCQLERPKSVAIDSKGYIWVDDAGNYRIQKFNEAGECLLAFGELGTKEGQFSDAESIAIDSKDDIWVADTYNHRLQEFSSEGKLIRVVQPAEGKSGHMVNPSGIDIGPGDSVWVCDWIAGAVIEFNEAGEFVKNIETTGVFDGSFLHPDTIDVDESGIVWVVDEGHGRVVWFSESGFYDGTLGSAGSGEGKFKFEYPAGITSDANGNLWIADSLNDRVQKWAR